MDGIYLIAVMIITGGAIAFIGDKLGTKIGKKRLSIFGLRPRHTSMIVTVITGGLITAPNRNNKTSTVNLGVEVKNSAQVDTLMNKLRRVENVFSVSRPMKIASD